MPHKQNEPDRQCEILDRQRPADYHLAAWTRHFWSRTEESDEVFVVKSPAEQMQACLLAAHGPTLIHPSQIVTSYRPSGLGLYKYIRGKITHAEAKKERQTRAAQSAGMRA